MPQIRLVVWNVQNLGIYTDYRSAWPQLGQFMANTTFNSQADVILIEELRSAAIDYYVLQYIQRALNALPAPWNNWYYDWIKGSVSSQGAAPYATFADLDWDAAHHEGYAVFWNQNISKFLVSPAPPIQPPGMGPTANSQSGSVRIQGVLNILGVGNPYPGAVVPAGGIVTPAVATPYTLPVGTTPPGGMPLGVATPAAAGAVLPVGTLIGAGGVTVNTVVANVAPVVIPGGYTLTDALALPAVGAALVPEHAMSLVLLGRSTGNPPATYTGDISGVTANFNPAGGTVFDWLYFTRGAGFPAMLPGARRPAFVTLDVNRAPPNNGSVNRLTPLIVYHAPAAQPASSSGMQRASYSQPLYQAYDWGAGGWVNCNNALLGGDFNVVTDAIGYAYNAYYNAFAAGGAACAPTIYNPAPPPPPPNQTRADNVLNKSMVQISTFQGAPIFSANPNDFRALAIDNIFYRGCPGAAGSLYDLPAAVSGGPGAIAGATVTGFLAVPLLAQVQNAIALGAPLPPTPSVNAPQSTVFDLMAGVFGPAGAAGNDTPARRAAEFVQLCVSDHLPVLFQTAM